MMSSAWADLFNFKVVLIFGAHDFDRYACRADLDELKESAGSEHDGTALKFRHVPPRPTVRGPLTSVHKGHASACTR